MHHSEETNVLEENWHLMRDSLMRHISFIGIIANQAVNNLITRKGK